MEGFEEYLRIGCNALAIGLITPDNCNAIDENDDGIIENYCYYTKYDDAEDVLRLVQKGCQVGVNAASYAARNGHINILREVLSFYPHSVIGASYDAFANDTECMKLLVETQLNLGHLDYRYSLSAKRYHRHRDSMRSLAIHTMHAMNEMRRKDMGRIIGRIIWASRSVTFDINESGFL